MKGDKYILITMQNIIIDFSMILRMFENNFCVQYSIKHKGSLGVREGSISGLRFSLKY